MIGARLMGCLGNLMFQVSAVVALSRRQPNPVDVAVSSIDHYIPLGGHPNVNVYADNIFRKVNIVDESLAFQKIYREPPGQYQPLPFEDGVIYEGYFQSEKYFLDSSDYISELFYPSDDVEDYIDEKYSHIEFSEATSLHVRRGDYVDLEYHPLCSLEYYNSALDILGDSFGQLMIFSDDIQWCKDNIKGGKEIYYIEGEKDYVDLYMMARCRNNIIANSSFSWWGAWLGGGRTIAPRSWFNPRLAADWSSRYSEGWMVI